MMRYKQLSTDKEKKWRQITIFCAYQERCHQEVREKLYSLGLYKYEVEQYISRLIEDNYLNEQRFAEQFAVGKFRMKQWGKRKIIYTLRQKKLSEYCIKKALEQIGEEDYFNSAKKIIQKKWDSFPKKMLIQLRKQKVVQYAFQKGYEIERIQKIVDMCCR